jgi:hypothetical protein
LITVTRTSPRDTSSDARGGVTRPALAPDAGPVAPGPSTRSRRLRLWPRQLAPGGLAQTPCVLPPRMLHRRCSSRRPHIAAVRSHAWQRCTLTAARARRRPFGGAGPLGRRQAQAHAEVSRWAPPARFKCRRDGLSASAAQAERGGARNRRPTVGDPCMGLPALARAELRDAPRTVPGERRCEPDTFSARRAGRRTPQARWRRRGRPAARVAPRRLPGRTRPHVGSR